MFSVRRQERDIVLLAPGRTNDFRFKGAVSSEVQGSDFSSVAIYLGLGFGVLSLTFRVSVLGFKIPDLGYCVCWV